MLSHCCAASSSFSPPHLHTPPLSSFLLPYTCAHRHAWVLSFSPPHHISHKVQRTCTCVTPDLLILKPRFIPLVIIPAHSLSCSLTHAHVYTLIFAPVTCLSFCSCSSALPSFSLTPCLLSHTHTYTCTHVLAYTRTCEIPNLLLFPVPTLSYLYKHESARTNTNNNTYAHARTHARTCVHARMHALPVSPAHPNMMTTKVLIDMMTTNVTTGMMTTNLLIEMMTTNLRIEMMTTNVLIGMMVKLVLIGIMTTILPPFVRAFAFTAPDLILSDVRRRYDSSRSTQNA